jgi:hypothetical protein
MSAPDVQRKAANCKLFGFMDMLCIAALRMNEFNLVGQPDHQDKFKHLHAVGLLQWFRSRCALTPPQKLDPDRGQPVILQQHIVAGLKDVWSLNIHHSPGHEACQHFAPFP